MAPSFVGTQQGFGTLKNKNENRMHIKIQITIILLLMVIQNVQVSVQLHDLLDFVVHSMENYILHYNRKHENR